MARRTALLYTPEFLRYNLGGGHPLQQRRLSAVVERLKRLGAFETIDLLAPRTATDEELARVHTAGYLNAVRRAGAGERGSFLYDAGLGPGDTPAFDGMYEAAALYAGASADAAERVARGEYDIAFNLAGGLHHAHADHASGFCTFNDLALAVHALLDSGLQRVAYVDIDVHHGDGVEALFWDDPRVLTVSLHESGKWLYPRTGFASDRGGPEAFGTALNVPFAPQTRDDVWHEAFDAVVLPALAAFAPQALVLQTGADAHANDPLAHLELTSRGWLSAVKKLLAFGEGMPIVVTGGGGYDLPTVERLWTLSALACAGLPEPEELHDAAPLPPQDPQIAAATRMYVRGELGTGGLA